MMQATPVDLVTGIRSGADLVVVEYRITNRSDQAIYFLAHPGDFARDTVRERQAYVSYRDEERTLMVSLLPPEPPPWIDYGRGLESLARRLGPGASYESAIDLSVPVRPWDPYPKPDPAPMAQDDVDPTPGEDAEAGNEAPPPRARTILFETAWFPESGMVARQPGPGAGTWWFVGSGISFLSREIDLPESIPVALSDDDSESAAG